jgi:hypothetical protein
MKAFDSIGDATVEDYPRGKFALFTVITVRDLFIEVSDAASLAKALKHARSVSSSLLHMKSF